MLIYILRYFPSPKLFITYIFITTTKLLTLEYNPFHQPFKPNDLQKRRAKISLKITIPSKKSRQAALREGI
jgi:hypothetical protein